MILLSYLFKDMLDKKNITLRYMFDNDDFTIYKHLENYISSSNNSRAVNKIVMLLNKEMQNVYLFRRYKIKSKTVLRVIDAKDLEPKTPILMKNNTIFREYNVLIFNNLSTEKYNFMFNTINIKDVTIKEMRDHYEETIGKKIEKCFALPE